MKKGDLVATKYPDCDCHICEMFGEKPKRVEKIIKKPRYIGNGFVKKAKVEGISSTIYTGYLIIVQESRKYEHAIKKNYNI